MDVPGPDLAAAVFCVITGVLAISANGILLFLIASIKDLRQKDYLCFILNRTVIDFIYSILQSTLQPAAILLSGPSSTLCTVAGFVELMFGLASIYSEPMLACNRYISIFHSNIYEKVYSSRNVYLICISIWVFGTITNVPHFFVGAFGRATGTFCTVRIASDTLAVILLCNYTFVFVGIGSVLFFNFRMFFYLNKYQKQPMTNSQRTKLQTDREILRFIFATAFLPMLFQLPAMISLWANMFIPVSGWLMLASESMFMVSFVLNPIITLWMIRPIRNQFVTKIRRLTGRHVSTVQVEPAAGRNSQIGPVSGNNMMIRVEELRAVDLRSEMDVRQWN